MPDVVGAALIEGGGVLALGHVVLHAVLNAGNGHIQLAVVAAVGGEGDACSNTGKSSHIQLFGWT